MPPEHHSSSASSIDGCVSVSVVIVTFNSATMIDACLRAVTRSDGAYREVIVVDNDSSDDTVDVIARGFAGVNIIHSSSNLGFARACNIGARAATGAKVLFLNPDTVVDPAAIATAARALDDDRTIGAVGALTLYDDGTVNRTCCFAQPTLRGTALRAVGLASLRRNSRLLNPEEIGEWDRSTTRDVGVITGCFLMMHRDLFEALEGFDERFFMYSEDTDLSLRILRTGRRCVHLADAIVVHHGGGSDTVPAHKMTKVLTGRALFFRKHWSSPKANLGVRLLDLTVIVRLLGARLSKRSSKWPEVWAARSAWNDPE